MQAKNQRLFAFMTANMLNFYDQVWLDFVYSFAAIVYAFSRQRYNKINLILVCTDLFIK